MDFWSPHGRIARAQAGPWAGRLVFLAPDSRSPWWLVVIDPPPVDGVSGDYYADEEGLADRLTQEWALDWLPRGEEEAELERARFGWRPLSRDGWAAPPPAGLTSEM